MDFQLLKVLTWVMNTNVPQVSVVIPAYNQARYLGTAIQSVLAQTHRDFEIIVVDDGSTDDTPLIAKEFGGAVHYVRQDNQGLAGARNTGISHARGDFVALLDSDDEWLPSYLEMMLALAAQHPTAAAYYCGWKTMDAAGNDMPQTGTLVVPAGELYRTLLRVNFIIPSTVLMRRSLILEAGLFDPAFRRLQDWEFWLRLLRNGQTIVGRSDCLLRYRIHGSSLSADPQVGQRAALAMVEKHFGSDDGQWNTWPDEKRRAYGGVYRYHCLTSVVRQNDWQLSAGYLRKALLIDPTLAADLDLFYELALGNEPPGYRGVFDRVDGDSNAQQLQRCLQAVYCTEPVPHALEARKSEAYGHAFLALGLVAYGCRNMAQARYNVLRAIGIHPRLILHPQALPIIIKSCLGTRLVTYLKRARTGETG